MANTRNIIVDVRDTNEFRKNGIAGSLHIPARFIEDKLEELKKYDNITFVCFSGTISRKVAHKYKDILNCKGDNLQSVKLL